MRAESRCNSHFPNDFIAELSGIPFFRLRSSNGYLRAINLTRIFLSPLFTILPACPRASANRPTGVITLTRAVFAILQTRVSDRSIDGGIVDESWMVTSTFLRWKFQSQREFVKREPEKFHHTFYERVRCSGSRPFVNRTDIDRQTVFFHSTPLDIRQWEQAVGQILLTLKF